MAVFFAGLVLSLCFAAVILKSSDQIASIKGAKLNPNIASAGELAELPSIGEEKARAIIDYRISANKAGVFEGPGDLKKVKGIGEKTIGRISPWLEFD